jgi:hypothetical protein
MLLLIGGSSLLVYCYLGIYMTTAAGGRALLHDDSSLIVPSSSFHSMPTPRFCIETSRCKTLRLDEQHHRNFSFFHISKASGASWVRELNNVLLVVVDNDDELQEASSFNNSSSSSSSLLFPQSEQGAEFSVVYQNSLHGDFDFLSYHLTSLRSPRHHVWSLFRFCKYGEWGVETTKGMDFPRTGTTPAADLEDFRTWLYHF